MVATQTLEQSPHLDISKNSILLVLRFHKPGNRRKVSPSQVEVDADPDSVTTTKELLDSEEFKAIEAFDRNVGRWLAARAFPAYGVLKKSAYRLPLSLVGEVDNKLNEMQAQRLDLVEEFLTIYPSAVEAAKSRLRSLYTPFDYTSPDAMRRAFSFEYRYMTFGLPETLSATLRQEERQKALVDAQSEVEEIKLALRSGFAALVQHAAERLLPGADGKKRIFYDSLVKNLEEFFQYFNQRNIVGDHALAALVEKARTVMKEVSPFQLRDNNALRAHIQDTMVSIKKTMDDNLMLLPYRRFTLEPLEGDKKED